MPNCLMRIKFDSMQIVILDLWLCIVLSTIIYKE